jgi:rfaE bifunctional protein nucleotidyltransferase chain/domain
MTQAPAFEHKIAAPQELARRIAQLARPIVFTNGVFDVLHRGHVSYLARARGLGASLAVGINSDASVRLLGKGYDRPLNAEADRAAIVAALESVSLVTIFSEPVPLPTLALVRPEIYVKGGDYAIESLPESAAVTGWGGRVLAIPIEHTRSTSAFLARVRGQG